MSVTMTKREVRSFFTALQALANADYSVKFAYAVARNRKSSRKIFDSIQEVVKPDEKFDKERVEIAKGMAKKDPEGNPIMLPNNQGYFVPDLPGFEERIVALKKETGQDKRDEEVEELLDEEENIEVYMVAFENLPETIRPDLLEAIMPMVKEPVEEPPPTEPPPTAN